MTLLIQHSSTRWLLNIGRIRATLLLSAKDLWLLQAKDFMAILSIRRNRTRNRNYKWLTSSSSKTQTKRIIGGARRGNNPKGTTTTRLANTIYKQLKSITSTVKMNNRNNYLSMTIISGQYNNRNKNNKTID